MLLHTCSSVALAVEALVALPVFTQCVEFILSNLLGHFTVALILSIYKHLSLKIMKEFSLIIIVGVPLVLWRNGFATGASTKLKSVE